MPQARTLDALPGSRTAAPQRGPVQRLTDWWQQRLPRTDTWTLTQRNVYILPTRAGLAFALTLVLMLLAAINYQLNLGYALTFLLAGAGVVSMHLTHGTLRGLTLHLRPVEPVFAGEAATLEVVLTNPGGARHGLAVRLQRAPGQPGTGRAHAWTDVPAQGQETVHLSLVAPHRGWHGVPTLMVETVFPFGLFRAWTLWRPAGRVLAWPAPEQPAPPLPLQGRSPGDDRLPRPGQGGEWDGVRPFRRGDTLRQVVWKKVARSGEMVSRESAGSGSRELWLDWADTPAPGAPPLRDAEHRIARLAAWVLAAERDGLACGLRLPGREWPPAQGPAHQRALLTALAEA
jgi:uncharacterized protein (DUF58 family)